MARIVRASAAGGGGRVVQSDDDAWELLNELIASAQSGETEQIPVKFEGWPVLDVKSEKGEQEIDTSTMQGYLALQTAIYRTFNQFKRERRDLNAFTQEERNRLRISVRVGKGSSKYFVDLQKILTDLGQTLAGKLEPIHILILVISSGLIWAGASVWRHHISKSAERRLAETDSEKQAKMLETFTTLSSQETDRIALLSKAAKIVPDVSVVEAEAEPARTEYVKHLPRGHGVTVEGVYIPPEVLEELAKVERRTSEEKTVTGVYKIELVKTGADDGFDFDVRLKDPKTEHTFHADFGELLSSTKVRAVVRSAVFDKRPLKLTLQTRQRDGEILSARIVDAKRVAEKKPKSS